MCVATTCYALGEDINPVTQDLPKLAATNGKGEQELGKIDNLIEVTKQNLESQKHLRELAKDYLQAQKVYMQNTQDKQNGFRMVKKAEVLLEKIKENHLTQAFDQEFLSELSFFASIATKWNAPG